MKELAVLGSGKSGMLPMQYAAMNGDLDTVSLLCNNNYDLNFPDKYGITPIYYAISSGRFNMVKFIVKMGGDVNFLGKDNMTPIHYAVASGLLHMVEFLVRKGCNVNVVNRYGMTPLRIAVNNGHVDIVRFLVKVLSDSKIADNNDWVEKILERYQEQNKSFSEASSIIVDESHTKKPPGEGGNDTDSITQSVENNLMKSDEQIRGGKLSKIVFHEAEKSLIGEYILKGEFDNIVTLLDAIHIDAIHNEEFKNEDSYKELKIKECEVLTGAIKMVEGSLKRDDTMYKNLHDLLEGKQEELKKMEGIDLEKDGVSTRITEALTIVQVNSAGSSKHLSSNYIRSH